MTPEELLRASGTIVLVDWPLRSVPETLARAGYRVISADGPGPEDYASYEVDGDEVVTRHVGRLPERADIVYSHRPVGELAEIARMARELGARAVWCQTGSDEARGIVEATGLLYIDHPPISDVAAPLAAERSGQAPHAQRANDAG